MNRRKIMKEHLRQATDRVESIIEDRRGIYRELVRRREDEKAARERRLRLVSIAREQGMTIEEIAEAMLVSRSRTHTLVHHAAELAEREEEGL